MTFARRPLRVCAATHVADKTCRGRRGWGGLTGPGRALRYREISASILIELNTLPRSMYSQGAYASEVIYTLGPAGFGQKGLPPIRSSIFDALLYGPAYNYRPKNAFRGLSGNQYHISHTASLLAAHQGGASAAKTEKTVTLDASDPNQPAS